jgi:Holliday junction resolvase
MSKMQRRKGARIEREIVELHRSLGLRAERVPLSGAARYQDIGADVDIYPFGPEEAPLCGEVKARANGEGFTTLERWLGENDFLALRRNNAEPIIVLPLACLGANPRKAAAMSMAQHPRGPAADD